MKDLFWICSLTLFDWPQNCPSYWLFWAVACPAGLRSSISVWIIPRASTNRLWKIRWYATLEPNLLAEIETGCLVSILRISWNQHHYYSISDLDQWVCCYSTSHYYSPCFLLSELQQPPFQDLQNWFSSIGWNFHSFIWAWSSSSEDHHSPGMNWTSVFQTHFHH